MEVRLDNSNIIARMAIFLIALLLPHAGVTQGLPELDCLVEPNVVVDVGSPEHGVVQTIVVDRSDTVSAEDTLAQLESSEQVANVRKARARANMAAEVNARKATLEFAQRKQERMRDLYASDAISSQQQDEVETELKMAQMQLQQARDASKLARIELDRAVSDLDRRTIRSPISGIVVERFVAPGEYVNEKPLLRVAQMDPLRVETVAPASLFGKIKTGMRARVVSATLANQVFDAEVTIVDRMIDPASGTFGVRLELPNPDYAIPSGLDCKLRIDPNMPRTASAKPAAAKEKSAAAQPKSVAAKPKTAATKPGTAKPQSTAVNPGKKPVQVAAKPPARKQSPKSSAIAKPVQECRSFGPFADKTGADKLIAALGKEAREIDRREVSDETKTGYIVMTPALATIDAAKISADELRKRGISDLAVMSSARYKGRISLGLYNGKANALKRVSELQRMSIDVELVAQNTDAVRYWSDIELSTVALKQQPWKKVSPDIMANDCPPSTYVAQSPGDNF